MNKYYILIMVIIFNTAFIKSYKWECVKDGNVIRSYVLKCPTTGGKFLNSPSEQNKPFAWCDCKKLGGSLRFPNQPDEYVSDPAMMGKTKCAVDRMNDYTTYACNRVAQGDTIIL